MGFINEAKRNESLVNDRVIYALPRTHSSPYDSCALASTILAGAWKMESLTIRDTANKKAKLNLYIYISTDFWMAVKDAALQIEPHSGRNGQHCRRCTRNCRLFDMPNRPLHICWMIYWKCFRIRIQGQPWRWESQYHLTRLNKSGFIK